MKVSLSIDGRVFTAFFTIVFLGFAFTLICFDFGLGFCFGVDFVSDDLFSIFLFFAVRVSKVFPFFSLLFVFVLLLSISKV